MPRMNQSGIARAGEVLDGRYEVISLLGEGGMGSVLLARDLAEGREICLKVLSGSPGDPNERALIAQEFRILKSLRHPNLEEVYDFGTLPPSGTPYFTSEYVRGRDLYAATEGMALADLAGLVSQACGALQFIHSRGLVHFDVKPENMLVDDSAPGGPRLKLIDFGLACDSASGPGRVVRGTPAYIAPEILRGEPADHRADLYSRGVTLHRLLCRAFPPPPGPGRAGRDDRASRPDTGVPAAGSLEPDPMRGVVLRLLDPVPDNRYAGAQEAMEDICRAAGRVPDAETPGTAEWRMSSGRFVGRAEETGFFAGLIDSKCGDGMVHVLTGEAGIGKTRLMREIGTRAQIGGWRFLRAAPKEEGGDEPGPMLKALAEVAPAGFAADGIPGAAPRPGARSGDADSGRDAAEEAARFREAVSGMLISASREKPVLLFLDDAQWADRETVETIAFVQRHLAILGARGGEIPPLLLFAAVRGDDASALSGAAACEVHRLSGLERGEIEALVASILGESEVPRPFADGIESFSSGNPLFVEEALKALARSGALRRSGSRWIFPANPPGGPDFPNGLAGLFEDSVKAAGPAARRVLEALSVWARPAEAGAAAVLAGGLPHEEIAASLRSLREAGLVDRTGGPRGWKWSFRHGYLRAFVRSRIEPGRLRALHEAAGRHLEADPAAGASPEEKAWHLLEGGVKDPGVQRALEAGARLRGISQYGSAAAVLAKALDLAGAGHPLRPELLIEIAESRKDSGDHAGALSSLEEALPLLEARGAESTGPLVETLTRTGEMLRATGRLGEAAAAFDRADATASGAGMETASGAARIAKAWVLVNQGMMSDALDLVRRTMRTNRSLHGEEAEGEAALICANILTRMGDYDGADAELMKAQRVFESLPGRRSLSTIHRFRGTVCMQRSRLAEAGKHLEASLAECMKYGRRREEMLTIEMLAVLCMRLLRLAEAWGHLRRGLESAALIRHEVGENRLLTLQGMLAGSRGDIRDGIETLRKVVEFWDARGMAHNRPISEGNLIELEVYAGMTADAATRLRRLRAFAKSSQDSSLLASTLRLLARYYHRRGKPAAVLRILDLRLGDRRKPPKGGMAVLLSQRALCLAQLGRLEESQRESATASKDLEAFGEPEAMLNSNLYEGLRLGVAGEFEASAALLEGVARRGAETGHRIVEASALAGLGGSLLRAGAYAKAEEAFRRAISLAGAVSLPVEGAAARLGMAEVLRARGDAAAAQAEIRDALALARGARASDLVRRAERMAAEGIVATPIPAGPPLERSAAGFSPGPLGALLSIFGRFAGAHPYPGILEEVMDAALSLSGLSRGFILSGPEEGFRKLVSRNVEEVQVGGTDPSRGIARQVFETGSPVYSADAAADPAFAGMKSVRGLGIRSLLCMPLRSAGRRIGVVYLDDPDRSGVFDPARLDLIQGLSDLAGVALEEARLRTKLEESEAAQSLRARNYEEQVKTQALALDEMRELLQARERELGAVGGYGGIVGRSEAMRRLFPLLDRVAATSLPVVIEGETGTGKELVARAIHAQGQRRGKTIMDINCAAIPETLLESELFGHVKGAFTGADRNRKGLIESANGGTLFLDEIGDMPMQLQSKLLRVLQEGEVRPLGAKASVPVDVRVICATNRDLAALVKAGSFREDLYYRLKVLSVRLPPLRDRREDIPILAAGFLTEHLNREGRESGSIRISPEALEVLSGHDWPGNVRELKNLIEGAAVFVQGGVITADDIRSRIGLKTRDSADEKRDLGDFKQAKADFEKSYVESLLSDSNGNVAEAARRSGIERGYLHRIMKKYKLQAADFKKTRGRKRGDRSEQ